MLTIGVGQRSQHGEITSTRPGPHPEMQTFGEQSGMVGRLDLGGTATQMHTDRGGHVPGRSVQREPFVGLMAGVERRLVHPESGSHHSHHSSHGPAPLSSSRFVTGHPIEDDSDRRPVPTARVQLGHHRSPDMELDHPRTQEGRSPEHSMHGRAPPPPIPRGNSQGRLRGITTPRLHHSLTSRMLAHQEPPSP